MQTIGVAEAWIGLDTCNPCKVRSLFAWVTGTYQYLSRPLSSSFPDPVAVHDLSSDAKILAPDNDMAGGAHAPKQIANIPRRYRQCQ